MNKLLSPQQFYQNSGQISKLEPLIFLMMHSLSISSKSVMF